MKRKLVNFEIFNMFLHKVLAIIILIQGCSGSYLYDLFEVVDITARSQGIPGVTPQQSQDGLTLKLTKDIGKQLTTESRQYSAIASTFMKSNDTTVSFNVKVDTVDKARKLAVFTLQDDRGRMEYVSLGIDFDQDSNSIEGTQTKTIIRQLVFLKRDIGTTVVFDYFDLGNKIQPGKLTSIMIRFQNIYGNGERRRRRNVAQKKTLATVYVDCEVVDKKDLNLAFNDPVRKFDIPQKGLFAMGMVYSPTQITNQFEGELNAPKIIVGAKAFKLLNACSKLTPQVVPSEPKPGDYDPTFFDEFAKMTSENIFPLNLECKAEDGTTYSSGETWTGDHECKKYTCAAGEISLTYTCKTCNADGKIILPETIFTTADEPCQQKLCLTTGRPLNRGTIQCPALKCDSFGSVKVPGECCEKCKSNSCSEPNTVFKNGCERKCSDGPNPACSSPKDGCYCIDGYARDENNVCIPLEKCKCRVDSKVYNPGNIIRKSSCAMCACASGKLFCWYSC